MASPERSEAAIFARLLKLDDTETLTCEAADWLLSRRFNDGDIKRMNDLSERAQADGLSAEEADELDSYIHVGNLISLMHAKARLTKQRLHR